MGRGLGRFAVDDAMAVFTSLDFRLEGVSWVDCGRTVGSGACGGGEGVDSGGGDC